MAMKSLEVQSLNIPFKQAFVHASAARAMTEAVLVTVTNMVGMEGIG
ncbi:MAG: hypothetical protein HP494_01610, partial [Nitrospira sp.]|nr:hypothetical protein [Nitrospira sp.]